MNGRSIIATDQRPGEVSLPSRRTVPQRIP
jgi:hypothetical protein